MPVAREAGCIAIHIEIFLRHYLRHTVMGMLKKKKIQMMCVRLLGIHGMREMCNLEFRLRNKTGL